MHGHRPLPVSIRALLVIALLVCMRLSADSSTSANSIQQNAAASEEMASTAEELSSQAEVLQAAIAFFKVDDAHQVQVQQTRRKVAHGQR